MRCQCSACSQPYLLMLNVTDINNSEEHLGVGSHLKIKGRRSVFVRAVGLNWCRPRQATHVLTRLCFRDSFDRRLNLLSKSLVGNEPATTSRWCRWKPKMLQKENIVGGWVQNQNQNQKNVIDPLGEIGRRYAYLLFSYIIHLCENLKLFCTELSSTNPLYICCLIAPLYLFSFMS